MCLGLLVEAPPFACLSGASQGSLERWWRPAAVFAQADLELGAYGGRFKRGVLAEKRWLVNSTSIVHRPMVAITRYWRLLQPIELA